MWESSSNQLNRTKRRPGKWEGLSSCCTSLSWDMVFFSCLWTQTETSALPGSLACRPSDWNYTVSCLESPACQQQTLGFVSLHNHMSYFLILSQSINQFIYLPAYLPPYILLLALLLWRTLTSTARQHFRNLGVVNRAKGCCWSSKIRTENTNGFSN